LGNCSCLASFFWLLSSGFFLLASFFWLLSSGFFLLASGFWLLASGFWLLASSRVCGDTPSADRVVQAGIASAIPRNSAGSREPVFL
jgi:hypothetical protein